MRNNDSEIGYTKHKIKFMVAQLLKMQSSFNS